MFRGIIPSKRIVSSEFSMVTPLGDSDINRNDHKSTKPAKKPPPTLSKGFGPSFEKKKRAATKGKIPPAVADAPATSVAFDQLLDDLQIPNTVRIKLQGMESHVKEAMVKSSQVMSLAKPAEPPQGSPRATGLRRTRSNDSLSSPSRIKASSVFDAELLPPRPAFAASGQTSGGSGSAGSPRKASGKHSRGLSIDSPGWKSVSTLHLPMSSSVVDLTVGGSKVNKEKTSGSTMSSKSMTPAKFFGVLSSTSSTQLDVEIVKKLRLHLRNESASWTQEFLRLGGYSALLTRLTEILDVEWREEQHDDQVLHELLRCFKALSTSAIGCSALRSSCPTPFVQLVALIYSDKKPGDIATRQLIIDILLLLFEIYPPSSLPCLGAGNSTTTLVSPWETSEDNALSQSSLIRLPAPHKNLYSLLRALLLTPAPPPAESPASPLSPHEFIESLHKQRIYKTYLQELSDVCRDYFWVFCHPGNKIWMLNETDETKVEKPRAPGGMTGGVEFEAMGYFTTHLRFINALAKLVSENNLPKDHELSAHRFHSDLFLSGFERIILISRKASTTYYPTLHLELARYAASATAAGYTLPYQITALFGLPPATACKNVSVRTSTPQSSPTKRRG